VRWCGTWFSWLSGDKKTTDPAGGCAYRSING